MSWNNYQFRNANEIDPRSILDQIRSFPDNDAPIRLTSGTVITKTGGTISTTCYAPDLSQHAPRLGEHTLREASEEEKRANRSTLAQIKYDLEIGYGNFGYTVANNFRHVFNSHFDSGKPITKREFIKFITEATDYPLDK